MTDATVHTRRLPDGTTIHLDVRGDVVGTATDALRRELVTILLRQRPHRVVVDLRHVTSLDPAAQGVLDAAADTADDLGISLTVREPATAVTRAECQLPGCPDEHTDPRHYRAAG